MRVWPQVIRVTARSFSMPQVLISDVYYGLEGCMAPIPGLPGFLVQSEAESLPPAVRTCIAGLDGACIGELLAWGCQPSAVLSLKLSCGAH